MFTVKGLPILADEIEVISLIREQVYQQQNREILRKIKRSGNNLMVCCPSHKDGQEKSPSCGILLTDRNGHKAGEFHCFTCHEVGTLEEFVSICFGYQGKSFGEKWLLDNFVTGETYERPDVITVCDRMPKKKVKPLYVSEDELASYRYYHPYMWQRKLTPEIVEKYDVGYQKDFKLITKNEDGTEKEWPPIECLTFPVRDKDGNCLFVSRRAIYNKNFFLPVDIQKPLYGIYELPKNCKDVVICESVFNALTCATWGIPAIALFGTGDEHQYQELIKLPIRHLVLGLDPDKAGAKGSYKLRNHLRKYKEITKLILPQGKDINDLTYDEFVHLPEVSF